MTLLLDTHVVLWWRVDSPRLKRPARRLIASAEVAWVSAASAWEVAIKQALGKLQLTDPFSSMVEDSQFDELPVTFRHVAQLARLPHHHGDPFDRMLIAQAKTEGATILTRDPQFEQYDVPVILV